MVKIDLNSTQEYTIQSALVTLLENIDPSLPQITRKNIEIRSFSLH